MPLSVPVEHRGSLAEILGVDEQVAAFSATRTSPAYDGVVCDNFGGSSSIQELLMLSSSLEQNLLVIFRLHGRRFQI